MKKKKAVLAAVTVALAGAIAATFTGCNLLVKQPDGNFPYDGAVQQGYTGTEAEWLASDYTPSTREYQLFQEAKREGYEGSYLDFLTELGAGVTDDSAAINYALTSVVAIRNVYQTSGTVETASGSGVIYSLDKNTGDAYIVTNYHVVYCVSKKYGTLGLGKDLRVYLYGSTTSYLSAQFYGGAMEYDLAVLKISGNEKLKETATNHVSATAAMIGDSDDISVGQRVYALGNPDGEGFSATGGIVSVEAEYIDIARADSDKNTIELLEIRTDAAVNHGNSGGGLFNAAGRLVGIVNARSEASGVVAFGYAIPANLVTAVVENIFANRGAVKLAQLKITVRKQEDKGVYDPATGKYFIEDKVVVETVQVGGAASAADLKAGDTLVSAKLTNASGSREFKLARMYQLHNILLQVRVGDLLTLTVSREGQVTEVPVSFDRNGYFTDVT